MRTRCAELVEERIHFVFAVNGGRAEMVSFIVKRPGAYFVLEAAARGFIDPKQEAVGYNHFAKEVGNVGVRI